MNLPNITDLEILGKKVLVRADLEWEGQDSTRERVAQEIVHYLREKGAERIKLIGHKGDISMSENLGVDMNWDLRTDPREETDDETLAAELALGFDVYVNEAFATSHRKHCSIDALPKLMKKNDKNVCVGLRFAKEVEVLEKIEVGVAVIGGAKSEDKERAAVELEKKGWIVLRGGLLPGARLREDGLDISDEAIAEYISKIKDAKVIVVAGPMGKFEDENSQKGTKEILMAVVNSKAYKIAGGGDTEAALEKFALRDKFDWISVGGGAMLEFLAKGTLPGIEALGE